jgi:transcription termination/antitermination protein NusG
VLPLSGLIVMSEEEQVETPDPDRTPPPAEPDAPAIVPPAESPAVDAETSATAVAEPQHKKKWFVVKVQSGREDSIKGALERRIKLENLEPFVGRIVVPVEKVTEVRDGKRRIKKVKKFPGYLFCEVEFNEHVLYLFRETSGVGDFVGGTGTGPNRLPQPMSEREVQRMLADQEELAPGESPGKKGGEEAEVKGRIKLDYDVGDTVKVREGMFANMEGPVKDIADRDSQTPKVKVVLTIWGRPVEVDLDYWQVDRA